MLHTLGRTASGRSKRVSRWRLWLIALAWLAAERAPAEPAPTTELAQASEERGAADRAPGGEAQAPLAPPAGVEVLFVKGRGADAIETNVPSSLTQFDASTIQAIGAQNVSDLARVTPNVNIVQPGSTQAIFFVRGIGLSDFSANAAGAVTILQDDVALNAPAIQTGQLFDIRDVEIVRGPQGTGPYRNASAGAFRVRSNLPTGNYGGQLRASIGRYDADPGKGAHRALIQDYEGAIEAPIARDWLSSRLAFRLHEADPYQTNGCGNAIPFAQRQPRTTGLTPAQLDARSICGERGLTIWPINAISQIPVGLPDKVDFKNNWAARGFLRLQPPDTELDFVLNGHGSRLDEDQVYGQVIGTTTAPSRGTFFGGATGSGGSVGYWEPDQRAEFQSVCGADVLGCNGRPAAGNPLVSNFERTLSKKRPLDTKPYRGDYDRNSITTRDTWGGYFSGKGVIDDIEISLLGSYDAYNRFRDNDSDFTPDVLFETVEADQAWQTWDELKLSGELERQPLQWELGGYYFQESQQSKSGVTLANNNRIQRTFGQDTDSFGTWGEFTWDFLDDFTLEGGVRWNWERKKFDLSNQLFLFGNPRGAPSVNNEQAFWQTPTGNLILTYHFNQEMSAFMKYSRGFKAGHFNALASLDVSNNKPVKPEFNDAWEAGLAGAWFDRRLSGSVNYFYYRYRDYQIFVFRDVANEPPVLEIVNANQAENYGVEVEGRAQPLRGWVPRALEGLLLTVNFGWLHGEFLDFQQRNTLNIGGRTFPVTIDFSGQQLQNSPEYKVSGSATWTFDLGRWGYVIPRYDFSWTDATFFGLNQGRGTATADLFGTPKLPPFAVGQPAYWLHNLRLAYRTPAGNVEVAAFVRNLQDTVYKTYAFDASNFSSVVLNFTGMPRTIGGDIIVTF
jgi:iron complex outermembrane recepter protein